MRACWLKWVGRDWSISADYIWLNYSGANTLDPAVPDQRVVRILQVVHGQRPRQHSAAHGLPCARRTGLPVAANDHDRVLMDIDGDSNARLFTG